ncbi:MAG: hypothetical protein KUG77_00595 [Nannocystaceae bacterium]|nr:hypothetical protein [Nannocystaceae bacterium]
MMDSQERERWRDAIAAFEDGERPSQTGPEPELLWSALQGELEAVPSREAVLKALSSSQGHEELRLFLALEQELGQELPQEVPAPVTGRVRRLVFVVGTLAAAAAAMVWMLRPAPPLFPEGGTIRAPAQAVMESPLDGQSLPRDAFELRWEPGGEGCTYDLRASTAQGVLLIEARGLTQPSRMLDAQSLPTQGRVLWQVDFVCEDRRGQSITFSTSVAP